MKVLGPATSLSVDTTKFTDATRVYLLNGSGSGQTITVRNAADDADIGSIKIGSGTTGGDAHMILDLEIGQGLRANTQITGTQIASGI